MKKLLSIILAIVLSLGVCMSFSSCANIISEKDGFFRKSTLKDAGLSGLSKPNFVYKTSSGPTLCGDIEQDEFDRYVQEVFTYLTDKYDYIGVAGVEYSNFFGGAGKYKYVECEQELSSYIKASSEWKIEYEFIFFRDKPKEGEETEDKIILEWYSTETHYSGSDIYWNFQMTLKNFGGLKDTYCYTNEESYEERYYSDDWEAEMEYPHIDVVRSETEWEKYQEERWYTPSYDFSKHFMVIITLSTPDSSVYYDVQSVKKQDDGFLCIIVYQGHTGEVGADVMGEINIVLEFDDYVQIYNSDDIILNIE